MKRTHREDFLIRRLEAVGFLSPFLYSDRFDESVRQFDFERLVSWSKIVNSRLAAEAIISVALCSYDPLHERAHQWISDNSDNKLLLAAALNEASRSHITADKVGNELILRYFVTHFTPKVSGLWQKLTLKQPLSWVDIERACDIKPADAFPSESQWVYIDSCRRILATKHKEDQLSVLHDTFNDPFLGDMPRLQFALAEIVIDDLGSDDLVDTLLGKSDLAYRGTTKALLRTNKIGRERQDILDKIAKPFAERVKQLGSEAKGALAKTILDTEHGSSFKLVCPFVEVMAEISSVNEKEVKALELFCKYCMKSIESEDSFVSQDLILRCMDMLSVERVASILVDLAYRPISENRWSREMPERYREVVTKALKRKGVRTPVRDFFSKDKVICPWFFSCYMDAFALNGEKLEEVEDFLASHKYLPSHNESKLISRVIKEQIIPHSLSAGCLLVSNDANRSILISLGYAPKPSDVENRDVICRAILTIATGVGKLEVRKSDIWNSEVWQKTIFQSQFVDRAHIASMAMYAAGLDDGDHWLSEHFLPECENRPELWDMFVDIGWSYGLLCRGSYLVNMDSVSKCIRRYVVDNSFLLSRDQKDRVISAAMEICNRNDVDLLKITSVSDLRDRFYSLKERMLPYEEWRYSFDSEEGKRSLKAWLLRHSESLGGQEWLLWVKGFEFYKNEPKFRKSIETYLDSPRSEEVELALAMLREINGIKQSSQPA